MEYTILPRMLRFRPGFSILNAVMTLPRVKAAFLLLACIIPGCDEGLAPSSTATVSSSYGISGTIHFRNWPPADSVVDLRLAALKEHPSSNIVGDVQSGKARFTENSLPYGVDSASYTLLLSPLPPGTFSYIGVAQRFGSDIYTDWRVVGIYYANGDTTAPGSVVVPVDSIVHGVNIYVDFHDLPPQP